MSGPLSVIIPVFNRPDHTRACLEALSSTDNGMPLRVIVPTNGSRGSTLRMIKEWTAANHGVVVEMDRNKGFAGGINAALDHVHDDRVVIMHNDVVVAPGWASEMSAVMDEEEDAAVVTCRTNYANEHSVCVPELRKRFEAIKPPNKARMEPRELADVLARMYPGGVAAEARSVAAGAKLRGQFNVEVASHCMLVREGLFAKYGGFDEEFFPRGFEDKYWFQALEWDGWACFVANRAYVHHCGNATSDGPGFCFSDVFKLNEQRFKEKSEKRLKERV